MSLKARVLIINSIKLSLNASIDEAFSLAKKRLNSLGISTREASFKIFKKSIDARNKNNIKLVYSIRADVHTNIDENILKANLINELTDEALPELTPGDEYLSARPLIVGAGPSGLFAALFLARYGYRPIIIERGGSISERREAVNRFKKFGILDINSNIQFGAGGAGTFSDGKLVTRINDPLTSYILDTFVEFGAPREIIYQAKPHIGTDILSNVIDNIINEIVRLGGEIRYHTKYLSTEYRNGLAYAKTTDSDINYGLLILALGHSARDTYEMLISSGYSIEAKQISVGMRIEHKREMIEYALYGQNAGHKELAHAEYNLSYNTKERGVYTFCMCPGGEVVAAASEENSVVVNGMSEHSRSGVNSNSAVVCSVFKEDYGASPIKAIEFQRKIERLAFISGGSNYSAPIITVGDFLNGECKKEPYEVFPTYRGGEFTRLASPSEYLPSFVTNSISNALLDFDKKIKGFASHGAILTGAETRTSAPIRILRDSNTRLAIGKDNIYPVGEGAGYAGGITSAAIDGIKTAISVIKRYKIPS